MPIKYDEWERKDKFWKIKEHSIEDYIYKLGNCTLLPEKLNKSVSNKIFFEKYEELVNKDSSWLLRDKRIFNKYSIIEIGENVENWDKDVIENRNQIIKDKIIETNLFKFDI